MFNPRDQFTSLREQGKFERMQEVVRDREIALQGSLNPSLSDFGSESEARQYAGRLVERNWRCPFQPRSA